MEETEVREFAHCSYIVFVNGKYRSIILGNFLLEGVFHGENFPWRKKFVEEFSTGDIRRGEWDFLARFQKRPEIKLKKAFFQLKLRSNIKS